MKKCHKKSDFAECPSCPFVNETKVVKSTANNFSVEINTEVDCQTKGIIYCITCKKCSVQYIGTSKKSLQDRFANHRGYVNNKDFSQPTGRHFNSRGHSISDMSVVIVEKVYKFEDRLLREERESHYIREFNSRVKGLNIDSWIALQPQKIFHTLHILCLFKQIQCNSMNFKLVWLTYLKTTHHWQSWPSEWWNFVGFRNI